MFFKVCSARIAAFFAVESARRAHFTRPGLIGTPSSSYMSSLSRFFTSIRGLPFNSSVKSEADAWLMAHPSPSKAMSVMIPASSTFNSINILSPQRGFVSWALAVASVKLPLFWGFLKWSRMISLYRSIVLTLYRFDLFL